MMSMQTPVLKGFSGKEIEINTMPRKDNLIRLILSCMIAPRKITCKALAKHFPDLPNISPRTPFITLVWIVRYQCNVMTKIQKGLAFDEETIKTCLSYLVDKGLIFIDTRPRKNHIGAYVYDKVYRSTVKGERLLVSIFDLLGLLDFESLLNEV